MTLQSRYMIVSAAGFAAAAACLTLVAQTPAPSQQPAQTQRPDVPPARDPAPQAGRGQGAGGRGGGQEADPFEGADLSPKEPITGVSPAEEQKRFLLQPGFRIEPVLTEPDIEEPMQIAFDGNGRMFVVEIRGYMQDADATEELAPTGRISVHEDANNDGVYEKHSVFVDKLVFPRFAMPIGANAILTMESNTDEVWKYTDTNGDSVADAKELFTANFGRAGNVEHQQSSLFWGMDNWLYSTYNAFRVRWTPNGVLREPTAPNNSQWGITQDNHGKVWFQGGASGLPGYFQLPIHYGVTFTTPGGGGGSGIQQFLEPGFEVPWGIAGVGDFQPGTSAIRSGELTLNRVTGAAGNDVVRAHRMPADMQGDYLYGEPVARIVRRAKPIHSEGLTTLRQVYQWQHAEFIRSTDHLFRPVDVATAPDGTLYVVDPYRGIIQEGNWTRPGSYLRAKVDQYKLASNIRKGRIWRVTYDGMARDTTQPRLLNETPAQLVDRLSHPNGWWRDAAQQLLVLKQDASVVPALQQVVRTSGSLYARFHALWTLEGLGALDVGLAREQMKDPNPQMRIQAIRASETLYKNGHRALLDDFRAAAKDADTDVMIQGMLTLHLFKAPDLATVVKEAQAANPARGVQLIGTRLLQPVMVLTGGGRGAGGLTPDQQSTLQRGETIYSELCSICHGPDGRGAPGEAGGTTKAPSFVGSPRLQGHRDYVVNAILHGMTGPIDGRTYSDVMVPMGTNRDEWVAAAASYVRNNFGNSASFVTNEDVSRVRAATADRKTPWTYPELAAAIPAALLPQSTWNVTASHNAQAAPGGLTYAGWSTGAPQQPGMWFQIELPEAVMLTEIQFNSTQQAGGRGGVPGGRRGRGAGDIVPGAATPGPGAIPAERAAPPPPVGTFPRGYRVQVSMDGKTWGAPAAEGQGSGSTTIIAFRPVRAKFVRITQTATVDNAPAWSIQRLRLYRAASATGAAAR
jgi:glucose/arabinose dehydrogenase/mono/diheme cytochrome c family protein